MTRKDDTLTADRYLGGKLLIASPSIGDPRFDRTVILMCDHSEDHAMGIVLNKPVEGLRLPSLLEQLGIEGEASAPDRAVLVGGPVERDRGFVLHSTDFASDDSTLPISDAARKLLFEEGCQGPEGFSNPGFCSCRFGHDGPVPRDR